MRLPERNDQPSALLWLTAVASLLLPVVGVATVWANPQVSRSDELGLNRRGTELVGQVVVVTEAITPGARGKVRAADTILVGGGLRGGA